MKFLTKNTVARFITMLVFLCVSLVRGPQEIGMVGIFLATLFAQTILPGIWPKYWQMAVSTRNRRMSLAFIRRWRWLPWILVVVPLLAIVDTRVALLVFVSWITAYGVLIGIIVSDFKRAARLRDAAREERQNDEFNPALDREKRRENARFLLHMGDGVDSAFHVNLWYPFCKTVDPALILAIRSDALYKLLRKTRPELHMEYIKAGHEAEQLVTSCPRLVGVLYVSNTGNTVHFLRFNHLRHVFIGHGDSEKAASCHKFFRAYDEVWTAGIAHIDRFRNSGHNFESIRFRIVGRPTLRPLLSAETGGNFENFLYLPTWEGFQADQEYTSLAEALKFIPQIAKLTKLKANVKVHPWTGKRNKALLDIETELSTPPLDPGVEIQVVERQIPVSDIMLDSAFLISDVSSVVSDYLSLGRPIFLYIPVGLNIRTSLSSVPPSQYCYIFSTPAELLEAVDRVIVKGRDDLRESRMEARQYFVDVGRSLGFQFEKELRNLIQEQDEPASKPFAGKASKHQTVIVGHRGAKGLFPENSLSGFKATAEMPGLDAIELDVNLTADGKLVVIHDPWLDRTTDGSGAVSSHRLDELRKMRLKPVPRLEGPFIDEGIPTLDEVLEILGPCGKEIHIEIKNDTLGRPYAGIAAKVLRLVRQHGLGARCVYTSFSPEVLEEFHRLDGDARLLASLNNRSVEQMGGIDQALARFAKCGGNCVVALESKLFTSLHAAFPDDYDFKSFGIWVVNEKNDLRLCKKFRLRQVTTDRPDIAISIMKGNQRDE